jgi:predicted aldo/keto reductase-like oxidoreductase
MKYVDFGKTGMKVSHSAFGALPIQRCTMDEAVAILRRAYDGGINFYDTARVYTDSEEKIGRALADVRNDIYLATKSISQDPQMVRKNVETSLTLLKTDHVDLFQFHNYYPTEELYETGKDLVREGKVLHIGMTTHSRELAEKAADSGWFASVQFPFSSLSDEEDIALVQKCENNGVGFIAMKALSGGLIRDVEANFAFFDAIAPAALPIWGIQHLHELEQFLALEESGVSFTAAHRASIEKDKQELGDRFCRGCGYCLPCPADIKLFLVTRMDLFMARSPYQSQLTKEGQAMMEKIEQCTDCHACAKRCPYGLKPYELIRDQLVKYRKFLADHWEEAEH